MTDPSTNPVGFLQEFCQKHNTAAFPQYEELGFSGPDHSRKFSIKCTYHGREVVAEARQKKQAKFEAAKSMVDLLVQENYFDVKEFDKVSDGSSVLKNEAFASNGKAAEPPNKNPISALQEYCQKNRNSLPNYFESETSKSGFVCECSVGDTKTYGCGSSKKSAKTEAASKMCVELNIEFINVGEAPQDFEVNNEKHAISALQEFCVKQKSFGAPVYESQQCISGLFKVTCNVGTLSTEGSDINKKSAKLLAAKKMLLELIHRELIKGNGGTATDVEATSVYDTIVGVSNMNISPYNTRQVRVLEEFDINSDNEAEKDSHEERHPETDEIVHTMDALRLNDSVVEIEPSTSSSVNMHTRVNVKIEANSNNVNNIVKKERISESEQDNGMITNFERIEDGLGVLNVSGDVILHSSSPYSSQLLAKLQGQEVTLTGVFGRNEGQIPFNTLNLHVNNLQIKQTHINRRNGHTTHHVKTPTSESLWKWAHKD